MARLGELLIAARLIEPEKVDQALRAQVVWGGRLGTNLIELRCIDLDGLSRALGRQHGLPAALARHFDKADPAMQACLSRELAESMGVVPLLYIGTDRRPAFAALEPLDTDQLDTLAQVYESEPELLVISVAAEMRVRYHLERVYKIARSTRFLRSRGQTATPFPQFDNVPLAIDSDSEGAVPITVDETEHPTGKAVAPAPREKRQTRPPEEVEDITALIDAAIETATTPPPGEEPSGRDRRTYVRTLADDDAVPKATGFAPTVATEQAALGRIAIRRVAIATDKTERAATAIAGAPRSAESTTFADATRNIRRGPNRDRVAELVVDTIQRFVPTVSAALLLVIRGDVAIGWKHFYRTGTAPAEIAVPLDQPGLVPTVIERNATARCSAVDLGNIDQLLLRSLGDGDVDLLIVPIAIGDRVMCLIAAASEPDTPAADLEAVAASAGAAFLRLIRDASR